MAEASPAPGVEGGGAALEETDSEAEARVTTEPLIVNFDSPKVGKRNCSIL